jgi:DNA-binding Xre family transcriptional regulator
MMHAYNENYLNNADITLGEAMDYIVNDCGISGDEFMDMFIISEIAHEFERGNPKYVAGKSGIEIAEEVLEKIKGNRPSTQITFRENKTPEYWAGWALAQYQWYTASSFNNIQRNLPFSEIVKLYPTLHEVDITKFYTVAEDLIAKKNTQSNLKRIRTAAGITQKKLAEESGVTLRSIQVYEQYNKDINKAQAITLAKIARALGCEIEALLEHRARSNIEV